MESESDGGRSVELKLAFEQESERERAREQGPTSRESGSDSRRELETAKYSGDIFAPESRANIKRRELETAKYSRETFLQQLLATVKTYSTRDPSGFTSIFPDLPLNNFSEATFSGACHPLTNMWYS